MINLIIKKPQNIKNDILSGITVALALVPEAIAFSFVAKVDPIVGLYAAFMMGLIPPYLWSTKNDFWCYRCCCRYICSIDDTTTAIHDQV